MAKNNLMCSSLWEQGHLDLVASQELAARLATKLKISGLNWVLFFEAEMGAGKTTFIREFGKALGIKTKITSPSFVGINEYQTDDLNFYHLDLYQVNPSLEDLAELIEDESKQIIIAIEWAEKLKPNQRDLFRAINNLSIKISAESDDERFFQIQSHPMLSKIDLEY